MTIERGVPVHRFTVSPRDARRHRQLLERLARDGDLSELDAIDLMATGVWSADLQRFIDERGEAADAIILAPYLFGTTYWGAQSWPGKSIVVPCLHDEPQAHLAPVRRMLQGVRRLAFNSAGEQALAERLLGPTRGEVVGMGIRPAEARPIAAAPAGLTRGRYFLYVGRVEEGKRVHKAAEYVAALADARGEDVRLAIIGSGPWRPSPEIAPHVTMLGFVDDDTKRAAMAGAIALINPSELESLSIVLLESWLEGRPALVAENSDVLRDHITRSGGGLSFDGRESFASAAAQLINDPEGTDAMGARGRDYVRREYDPEVVLRRLLDLIG
jgi:glycosyltransferase involved in cell wall biosynthesis